MSGDARPLGWDTGWASAFAPYEASGLRAARVVIEERGSYLVRTTDGELRAEVSGRFRYAALGAADFPAVGDWVAVDERLAEASATIHMVLPRRSAFVRRAPGRGVEEQVLAANVDLALVVMSVNRDFNLRRLERYLATAWESGASPVVVLTKADLADDLDARRDDVARAAPGVGVHAVSARTGLGLDDLAATFEPGRTIALLGSSGVGKSTLVNILLGEDLLTVREIRSDDDRGRHMTTRRQLVELPGGALVVDTPGMRELGLLDGDGLADAFADLEDLARSCRFTDCGHGPEPGCAVREAIEDGRVSAERLRAHRKLEREARHAQRELDPRARAAERRRWTIIGAQVQRQMRAKYGAIE